MNRRITLSLLTALLTLAAVAQQDRRTMLRQNTDYELWTGPTVRIRFTERLRLDLEQQLRFMDTVSTLKKTYLEAGIRYRLNELFSVKTAFRYIAVPSGNDAYRLSADLIFGWSPSGFPLRIGNRIRFEDQRQLVTGGKKTNLRNKTTLEYNLGKTVDPYVEYEIFFRFNGKDEFRQERLTAGLEWRLCGSLDLTSFYRIENQMGVKKPDRTKIFGILLTWDINPYRKTPERTTGGSE